jgi:hypothetical protein
MIEKLRIRDTGTSVIDLAQGKGEKDTSHILMLSQQGASLSGDEAGNQ